MTDEERKAWKVLVHDLESIPNVGLFYISMAQRKAILAADEEIKRLREAVRELVNERQPLGIDRPAYQKALAALAKEEGEWKL
jgi:hypothetical protein